MLAIYEPEDTLQMKWPTAAWPKRRRTENGVASGTAPFSELWVLAELCVSAEALSGMAVGCWGRSCWGRSCSIRDSSAG